MNEETIVISPRGSSEDAFAKQTGMQVFSRTERSRTVEPPYGYKWVLERGGLGTGDRYELQLWSVEARIDRPGMGWKGKGRHAMPAYARARQSIRSLQGVRKASKKLLKEHERQLKIEQKVESDLDLFRAEQ